MMLKDGNYNVRVDTELKNGYLTISECVLQGQSEKEILFSSYTCHPQMCNDSISGTIVAAFLYEKLSKIPMKERKFTYRFVFLPETIGSIAYLKLRGMSLKSNVIAGYVLTTLGDAGHFTYKKSKDGSSAADRIMIEHLNDYAGPSNPFGVDYLQSVFDFSPGGSDERQYCSPAFNLPVGCICRSMYYQYKEYHTSADDMSLVTASNLVESIDLLCNLCLRFERSNESFVSKVPEDMPYKLIRFDSEIISGQSSFVSLVPYGEPQLGKRGMYHSVGSGIREASKRVDLIMWLLQYSTGVYTLYEIAAMSQRHYNNVDKAFVYAPCYCFQPGTVEDFIIVARELLNAGLISHFTAVPYSV